MAGDKKTTQTQTSQAKPVSEAQPLFNRGFGAALDNFNAQDNRMYTQAGDTGAQWVAHRGRDAMRDDPIYDTLNTFGSTFGQDGYNPAQRQAMGGVQPFTTGGGDVSTAGYDRFVNAGPTMSAQNLSGIARGDMLSLDNPDFERILKDASERAATEASMAASGMGRTGSDYHQGVVADRVGDLVANARLGQYNTERDRQMQANQIIDSINQGQQGLSLSALNSQTGTQQANRDRQMQALAQQFGMGQTGMGNIANAGQVYEGLLGARLAPGAAMMEMGQMPNRQIADLLGAASYGNPFATSVMQGTQTAPSNTFGKVAGGLLGGASLLFG